MILKVDTTGCVGTLRNILDEMADNDSIQSVMVLACASNAFTPQHLDPLLQQFSKPLFGGVFPGLIHGANQLESGTIVVGFTSKAKVLVVEGLSDSGGDYDAAIDQGFPDANGETTMFVFTDAYAKRTTALIDSLFTIFGLEINYIGGCSGSLEPLATDMSCQPCIISNKGMLKDSAILALTEVMSGVGVSHGWEKVAGPYKVTRTKGNRIAELDWHPAFDVYREVVEKHSSLRFDEHPFFSIAKAYPLGISRLEAEKIVRDPFSVDGTDIVFGVDIPQESFVDILTGDKESLQRAVLEAKKAAADAFGGTQGAQLSFVMDCISRVMFLEDDFSDELQALADGENLLVGALSMGEIANTRNDFLELYNKTCVVGMLAE